MKNALILAAGLLICTAPSLWAQEPVPLSKLPFSPARLAGNTLYVSGQVARNAEGKDVKESVEAETRQVMENLGRILKEHGYGFGDVVSATVYLTDIKDYHTMNKVYASYFREAFPSRACVGGVELVFGFKVEISCIAYKDPK